MGKRVLREVQRDGAHLGVGLGLVGADKEANLRVIQAAPALQRLRHCHKVLHLWQLIAVDGAWVPVALQPPALYIHKFTYIITSRDRKQV